MLTLCLPRVPLVRESRQEHCTIDHTVLLPSSRVMLARRAAVAHCLGSPLHWGFNFRAIMATLSKPGLNEDTRLPYL